MISYTRSELPHEPASLHRGMLRLINLLERTIKTLGKMQDVAGTLLPSCRYWTASRQCMAPNSEAVARPFPYGHHLPNALRACCKASKLTLYVHACAHSQLSTFCILLSSHFLSVARSRHKGWLPSLRAARSPRSGVLSSSPGISRSSKHEVSYRIRRPTRPCS